MFASSGYVPKELVWFMVFSSTVNNISDISSVLLAEETGVLYENHRPAASYWKTLSHNALYRVHFACAGLELTTFNSGDGYLLHRHLIL